MSFSSDETNDGDSAAPAAVEPIPRREERRATNWIAMIRLADGTEIPTIVKDASPSGACLVVPRAYPLPTRFMFKVVGHGLVFAARLAWRRGDQIGVSIERVAKLPAAAPSPEAGAPPEREIGITRAHRSRISKF